MQVVSLISALMNAFIRCHKNASRVMAQDFSTRFVTTNSRYKTKKSYTTYGSVVRSIDKILAKVTSFHDKLQLMHKHLKIFIIIEFGFKPYC